jgi:hypothetical protein
MINSYTRDGGACRDLNGKLRDLKGHVQQRERSTAEALDGRPTKGALMPVFEVQFATCPMEDLLKGGYLAVYGALLDAPCRSRRSCARG